MTGEITGHADFRSLGDMPQRLRAAIRSLHKH